MLAACTTTLMLGFGAEYVLNTFAFGYAVGYRFIKSPQGSCNGNFVGIGADLMYNASVQVGGGRVLCLFFGLCFCVQQLADACFPCGIVVHAGRSMLLTPGASPSRTANSPRLPAVNGGTKAPSPRKWWCSRQTLADR